MLQVLSAVFNAIFVDISGVNLMLCLVFAKSIFPGSQKLDCFSRLTECNPAHQIPTAAEHLALTYSSPYGGSSIHIKAEVTHGAGECTNEALTVMMGGSGSCWCFWQDIRKLQSLLVMKYPLPCLVEFPFDLICFLSGTLHWSHYYCSYYNCYHLHLNEDPVIMFSSTIITGNLIDSFVNIIKSFKHIANKLCLTTLLFDLSLSFNFLLDFFSFLFCIEQSIIQLASRYRYVIGLWSQSLGISYFMENVVFD